MGLFSPNIRAFCSVIFENNICNFYFRHMSNKKVLKEDHKKILDNSCIEISDELALFLEDKEAQEPIFSIMLPGLSQGIVSSQDELEQKELNPQDFDLEFLDKDVFIYTNKLQKEELSQKFGVNFSYEISIFKILYFLLKNQEFENNSMFVLKTDENIAIIVADKNGLYYSNIVSITDEFLNLSLKEDANLDITIDDIDEVFFIILKNEIEKFYASENANFINNIFIYNNGSLNNEAGYVIYTRLLIRTSLVPVFLPDYINKISIKLSSK